MHWNLVTFCHLVRAIDSRRCLWKSRTVSVTGGYMEVGIGWWSWKSLVYRTTCETTNLCLKRPSYYCLIHFYKRCVSALARWVAHLRVRSGWVSVLFSHKTNLLRAKESSLKKENNTKRTIRIDLQPVAFQPWVNSGHNKTKQPLISHWASLNWMTETEFSLEKQNNYYIIWTSRGFCPGELWQLGCFHTFPWN